MPLPDFNYVRMGGDHTTGESGSELAQQTVESRARHPCSGSEGSDSGSAGHRHSGPELRAPRNHQEVGWIARVERRSECKATNFFNRDQGNITGGQERN